MCFIKDYDLMENLNLKVEACLQDGAHGSHKFCNYTWVRRNRLTFES